MIFLKKEKKAFTLVELLVVISIIGVLSSTVFASLSGAKSRARDAKLGATVNAIQKGLELYFDKYGYYPQKTEDECGGTEGYTTSNNNFMQSLITEGFLTSYPVDTRGINCGIQYTANGNPGVGYVIFLRWESKPVGGCNPLGPNHLAGWSCAGFNMNPGW
jgi:prepilin-type N-terminal cleavage/methylation domain-containing protein